MNYLGIDWGDKMPEYETFGKLTEEMLNDGIKPYEIEEDKSNILFDGTQDGEKSKDLGWYHIRAGSTPTVLLAWKENAPETYQEYLRSQPRSEYFRQFMWLWFMTTETGNMEVGRKITEALTDMGVTPDEWTEYTERFIKYHGL